MRNLHLLLSVVMGFITLTAFAAQEYGLASVYSEKFDGSRTASGEIFNHKGFTAAHRTLPYGTLIRITRTDNGKSVVVRINDRGPFVSDRITDISKAAATKLRIKGEFDEVRVKLEIVNDKKTAAGSVESSKRLAIPVSDRPQPVPMPDNIEKITSKSVEDQTVPREYRFTENKKQNVSLVAESTSKSPNKLATLSNIPKNYNKYGLYAVKINGRKTAGFAVQVASLASHDNMLKNVEKLQQKSFDNVLVNITKGNDGDPDYKILLGPFDNAGQAESYLKSIKKKNLSGFVVGL